jgi:hypothetical protein
MTALWRIPCVLSIPVLLSFAPAPAVTVVRLPEGAIQPQTAVDAKGVVHVLYFKGDAAHGDLFYAHLDASDRVTAPIRVDTVPGSAQATGTMRGGHLAIGKTVASMSRGMAHRRRPHEPSAMRRLSSIHVPIPEARHSNPSAMSSPDG